MQWTDRMLAGLRRDWDDGVPTAEIGRRLGVSKNAICGKKRRLDLPNRPSPLPENSPTRVCRGKPHIKRTVGPTLPSLAPPPAPVVVVPVRPAPPPVVAPVPRYLQRIRECCWPIGDPGTPSFRFCDEPAVAGKPAYVRVRDRREDAVA